MCCVAKKCFQIMVALTNIKASEPFFKHLDGVFESVRLFWTPAKKCARTVSLDIAIWLLLGNVNPFRLTNQIRLSLWIRQSQSPVESSIKLT